MDVAVRSGPLGAVERSARFGPFRLRTAGEALLRVVVAAGLGVDAAVHAQLAPLYDGIRASVSEGQLFELEAAMASLAALAILAWPARLRPPRRWIVAAACSIAATALAALLVSRYVDVGPIGPFPNLYEPAWFADKTLAAGSEIATLAAGIPLLLLTPRKLASHA